MIESNTTRLGLVQTLYFYDVPQLILLQNQLGHLYLCLLSDDETMTYLGVSVSKERVQCLINGDLDLRDAYTSPEVQSYYLVTLSEEGTYMIVARGRLLPFFFTRLPRTLNPRRLTDMAKAYSQAWGK